MRNRFLGPSVALLAALVSSSVALAQTPPQSGAAKANAAAPAPQQDISGVWVLTSRSQGLSREAPPMTPSGQAMFKANIPGFGPRAAPGGNDPISQCDPLGLPRTLLSERPIQFVQIPGRVLQFFEWYHTWRDLWTDGRELPQDPDPKWFGSSVGKWQGDTFVVDTVGFDERTWLDQLGYPHSDAMRLQERYRRADHDTLELTLTLDDPKVYTKPWVSDKKILQLQPQQQLAESFCVGSEEESYNQRMRNPAAGK
ncbi:MAG: hypothetical protein A3J28_05540 [Acidobacteria bacterium RIFCSPLOWO2_12_FULL_60_22]|nr:MAG: hypothetical protein A3J28_05540 [Acidobacteria bacterium RIFCSPLOWO2_12_FULL_60_22]